MAAQASRAPRGDGGLDGAEPLGAAAAAWTAQSPLRRRWRGQCGDPHRGGVAGDGYPVGVAVPWRREGI